MTNDTLTTDEISKKASSTAGTISFQHRRGVQEGELYRISEKSIRDVFASAAKHARNKDGQSELAKVDIKALMELYAEIAHVFGTLNEFPELMADIADKMYAVISSDEATAIRVAAELPGILDKRDNLALGILAGGYNVPEYLNNRMKGYNIAFDMLLGRDHTNRHTDILQKTVGNRRANMGLKIAN